MQNPEESNSGSPGVQSARELIALSRRILSLAHKGFSRNEYLKKVTGLLMSFCDCDYIELRLVERGALYCSGIDRGNPESYYLEKRNSRYDGHGHVIPCLDVETDLEQICQDVLSGKYIGTGPYFTPSGTFYLDNTRENFVIGSETRKVEIEGDYQSLGVIPFSVEGLKHGLLIVKAASIGHFSGVKLELFEEIAEIMGISFTFRRAQVSLRERVKELTTLYGIAKTAARPGISLVSILQAVVKLLPPGWLYPQYASARIILDDGIYVTKGFEEAVQRQSADIITEHRKRGVVEIAYRRRMPDLDEGPFMKEERDLIDAVAGEIGLIAERKEAEREKERLREQLRHSDRLATIGQLAAGVAHELNEPLGSILGFAQLAQKTKGVPSQAAQDIDKIEKASLHAREVVRKLMIFARQTPTQKEPVDLSNVVSDGLYFLASRCRNAGIELVKKLADNLPKIVADRAQMYQVLVNLVVNAVQATRDGGTITISTARSLDHVSLTVEDNGGGMSEDVMKRIFMPFYTTKDVDEGTGLGLSVVHGIVASHGGDVIVESNAGKGSKFKVRLPIKNENRSSQYKENDDA